MNFKVVFIIVSLEQKANLKNFRVKFMLFRKYSMGQCYKIQILQFFNRCRMFLNYSLIITSRNVDWQQQFFLLQFSLKMILKVTQFFSNCYSIRCYFYLHCWIIFSYVFEPTFFPVTLECQYEFKVSNQSQRKIAISSSFSQNWIFYQVPEYRLK